MLPRLTTFFSNLSATKQFFLARTFYDWAIYVFDAFYMTYVFKESGEVQQVVYNILLTLVTIFAGFVLGSFFMKKVGVERNLRFSFILYILTGLLGIYLINIGAVSFVVISIARGIAEGFFWASANYIELAGLPYNSRSKFYSASQGFNGLFNIVAPVTLGYLLTKANSLLPVFAIFTTICALALFIPFNFNLNDKLTIRKENFRAIFKRPKIKKYITVKMVLSAAWMLDWLLFAIMPFVILGNELNMGIYLTISSLIGILLSFVTMKLTVIEKVKYGGPLLFLTGFVDAFLVVVFNPVALYINSIIHTITSSVTIPMEYDMTTRITNEIDEKNQFGVELNILQEFFYTISRLVIGIVVVSVISFGLSVVAILKVLIVLIALLKMLNFLLSVKFLKIITND